MIESRVQPSSAPHPRNAHRPRASKRRRPAAPPRSSGPAVRALPPCPMERTCERNKQHCISRHTQSQTYFYLRHDKAITPRRMQHRNRREGPRTQQATLHIAAHAITNIFLFATRQGNYTTPHAAPQSSRGSAGKEKNSPKFSDPGLT